MDNVAVKIILADDDESDRLIFIEAFSEIRIKAENDIEESFQYGANVYLKKPSDFNKLKEALYKVVSSANPFLEPIFNIDNFLMKV